MQNTGSASSMFLTLLLTLNLQVISATTVPASLDYLLNSAVTESSFWETFKEIMSGFHGLKLWLTVIINSNSYFVSVLVTSVTFVIQKRCEDACSEVKWYRIQKNIDTLNSSPQPPACLHKWVFHL